MNINAYLTKEQAVLLEKVVEKTGMSKASALREGLKLFAKEIGIEEADK